MNTREIKALRKKFIVIAMVSIFLAMLFIGATINTGSLVVSRIALNKTLDSLADNAGKDDQESQEPPGKPSIYDLFVTDYSRNRYYVFIYSQDGTLQSYKTNMQETSELATVTGYANELIKESTDSRGSQNNYFYRVKTVSNQIVVAMVDASIVNFSELRLMYMTFGLGFMGMVITFFLVRHFSGKAIQPEIENSMRQRQFITNASHELKTPLAVIRANTEMTELLQGESEWTQSTLKQVDHLSGLIQNLVMIARSEEKEDRSELSEIDAAAAVNSSVDPYESLAAQSGKTIERDIQPATLVAAESKLRQLTTLLVDNALKYCDDKGKIKVALAKGKGGKGIVLTVSNDYADGSAVDVDRFFDRFYREDQSHNIDKGGYGIGLSIAESICKGYNGDIRAEWKNGVISFICTLK